MCSKTLTFAWSIIKVRCYEIHSLRWDKSIKLLLCNSCHGLKPVCNHKSQAGFLKHVCETPTSVTSVDYTHFNFLFTQSYCLSTCLWFFQLTTLFAIHKLLLAILELKLKYASIISWFIFKFWKVILTQSCWQGLNLKSLGKAFKIILKSI